MLHRNKHSTSRAVSPSATRSGFPSTLCHTTRFCLMQAHQNYRNDIYFKVRQAIRLPEFSARLDHRQSSGESTKPADTGFLSIYLRRSTGRLIACLTKKEWALASDDFI